MPAVPAFGRDRHMESMKATEVETDGREPASDAVPTSPRTERLVSLDALRGFDMFWITGGTAILLGLGKVIQRPFFDKFLEQFDHVPWQCLHFYDLIWPLFMFIMISFRRPIA
jgi:predicted acyltransferase